MPHLSGVWATLVAFNREAEASPTHCSPRMSEALAIIIETFYCKDMV